MQAMPISDAPRKPLLGLRVIEAWCWLWAIFCTVVGYWSWSYKVGPSAYNPPYLPYFVDRFVFSSGWGLIFLADPYRPHRLLAFIGVVAISVIAILTALSLNRRASWALDWYA